MFLSNLIRLVGQKILLISTSAILVACMATMATYYDFFPPIPSSLLGNYTGCEMDASKPNNTVITLPDLPPCGSALFYIPVVIFVIFFFALGAGIGTHFTIFIGDLPQQGLKITLPAVMVKSQSKI